MSIQQSKAAVGPPKYPKPQTVSIWVTRSRVTRPRHSQYTVSYKW